MNIGRKPSVSKHLSESVIRKYQEEFIREDRKNIVGVNHEIWKKITDELSDDKVKVTPAAIRINVAKRKSEFLNAIHTSSSVNANQDHQKINHVTEKIYFSSEDGSTSDESSKNHKEKLQFDITFSINEWNSIKPRQKTYKEQRGTKVYNVLTPFEWSNIVQSHFFLHTKLPCSLTFKKAYIRVHGVVYISLRGRCSDCGSIFKGDIDSIPATDTRVVMNCVYYGDFHVKHFNKRRMIGSQKTRALNAMLTQKIDPLVYIRNQAKSLMNKGDSIPVQIPNIGALRVAKFRAISATQYHSCPLLALNLMKLNPEFDNTIHDIGFNKFFIHFWSPLQLQILVYRDNYKKNPVPTISFDATGGCCQKLIWNKDKKSGAIYLYEGVTNIDNQSFTVLSMLSEQHDNISISNWLKRWLKCEVKAPKVVISDQSLALMSALVQAFTQYESLEKYLNVCFSLVVLKQKKEIPKCFIRNDVNHCIHLICQWKAVKNSRYPNTKQLIIRGMGLLVLCTTIIEIEKILRSIFTIILSKSDGELIQTNQNNMCSEVQLTPCAKSKKYLKDLINCSDQTDYLQFEHDDLNYLSCIQESCADEYEDIGEENQPDSFKGWAQSISNEVKEEIEGIEGSTDNAQFLPELESTIIKTMKLFPCWSSVMINIFGYGTPTASSSRIESNFNHIKNRVFKNENLPLRVDYFLEMLLKYYRGDQLLLQGQNRHDENSDYDDGNKCKINNVKHQADVEENDNRQTSIQNSLENDKTDEDEHNTQNKKNDNENQNDYNALQDNDMEYINNTEVEYNHQEESKKSDFDYLKINEHEYLVVESGKKTKKNHKTDNILTGIKLTTTKNINIKTTQSTTHLPCANGDFPTVFHKCVRCKQSIPLFGCSVSVPGIEEDYGEERLCLACDKVTSEIAENKASENWNRKGKNQNSLLKRTRSARSYIVPQPGFDLIDSNKLRSSTLVYLLKNGNSLLNKPISVNGIGKLVLNNTCTVDSIMSILASSAADSIHFRKYLEKMVTSNLTASLAIQMISQKNAKQIYLTRLMLLLQFFNHKTKTVIGGLLTLDITDTVASMADKLLKEMPSFIRFSHCKNTFCPVPHFEHTSSKLSLNIFSEKFSIQNELEEYVKDTKETCVYCGNERYSVVTTTTHILVELNSIPLNFNTSTSTVDIDDVPLDLIKQNFAKPNMCKLHDIEPHLMLKGNLFKLRGIINFHGSERSGLRCATGHYTVCSYRSNQNWELYDDTKLKIQNIHSSKIVDTEMLIFTI